MSDPERWMQIAFELYALQQAIKASQQHSVGGGNGAHQTPTQRSPSSNWD